MVMGRVAYFARVWYRISDGVVIVGWVLEATWIGVRNLQVCCVSCHVSFAATHTAMPPLIFALNSPMVLFAKGLLAVVRVAKMDE
jgi:hypothetical protein